MRISGIRLGAYGHFTGFELRLGDKPGLHVVFAPNEAGKSTLLRGLVSALFGYPTRIEDDFLHDTKDMSVGADLVAKDGKSIAFNRRRRGKAALADLKGGLITESDIVAMLGGVSKELFTKVFGMNHLALHAHAAALMEEGGSLGYSLAEAATGITGLKNILADLKTERDEIFLPNGSRPKINQRLARLNGARQEARRRTVTLHAYRQSEGHAVDAAEAVEAAQGAHRLLGAELRRLERIHRNLPRFISLGGIETDRQTLGVVPALSAENASQEAQAAAQATVAKAAIDRETEVIAELETQKAGLTLDPNVLSRRDAIALLKKQRTLARDREDSLPKREAELKTHIERAGQLLAGIEVAGDPTKLDQIIPTQLRRAALRSLLSEGLEIAARLGASAEKKEEEEAALRVADATLAEAPETGDPDPLALAIEQAASLGAAETDIARRTGLLERLSGNLKTTIQALGVSDGLPESLRAVQAPPAATLARYAERLSAIDKVIERSGQELLRLQDTKAQALLERARLEQEPGFATEATLAEARTARDEAWALVRAGHVDGKLYEVKDRIQKLTKGRKLPDVYEEMVTAADAASDSLRSNADAAARHRGLDQKLNEIAGEIASHSERKETSQAERQTLLDEWAGLWQGLAQIHPPAEMREFIDRRDRILGEADKASAEADSVAELNTRLEAAKERLRSALKAAGNDQPAKDDEALSDFLLRARSELRRLTDIAALRARQQLTAETVKATLARANAAHESASGAHRAWSQRWQAALKEAGLPVSLTFDQAETVLEAFSQLTIEKRNIEETQGRIADMRDDVATFKTSLETLSTSLGGAQDGDPFVLSQDLEERLEAAEAAARQSAELDQQIVRHRLALDAALASSDESNAVITALCERAGGCTPAELAATISRSLKAADLDRRRKELEDMLVAEGGGLSLASLKAECEDQTGDALSGLIAEKQAEAENAEAQLQAAIAERARCDAAFKALFGDSQAVDLEQEAASIEAEIALLVEEYTRLTLQEATLRKAIETYRLKNENGLIARARGIFVGLTNGRYTGLRTDYDDKNETVIIAEHSTRGSLEVRQLSDGAADSLYLALRFAVVEEHNERGEPLPFIADDLLLTLDNDRATATLKTLSRIARSSQVILMTHHEHMVPLARAAVPGDLLQVHRMSVPGIPAVGSIAAAE